MKKSKQNKKNKNSNNDLAKEMELSIAVMNLLSVEEQLGLTAAETKKSQYLDILDAVRKLRSKYMHEIIKNKEGELWCISKHLLATAMRLMETAVKYNSEGKKEKAMELLNDSIEAYQLFWLLQSDKKW